MIMLQKIRGVLFYLSLIIFFMGLPFILAFALGYKFNSRTLKFVKTGLIFVKTVPAGAKIYLNAKLISQKSPASIQELLPGTYEITLELAQHYPWKALVEVETGKVSRVDKIILFPWRPNLQQLNQERFSSFRINTEKKWVYYLDQEKKVLYRSSLAAHNFEDIASLPDKFSPVNGWEVSSDQQKVFIFNQHQISVIFFDTQANDQAASSPVFLDYPQEEIINVFWHSDSYHLVVLTDKHIGVIESFSQAEPINLVELNRVGSEVYYDIKEDALYFSDAQKSLAGGFYNNLYKLELNANFSGIENFKLEPFGRSDSLSEEELR